MTSKRSYPFFSLVVVTVAAVVGLLATSASPARAAAPRASSYAPLTSTTRGPFSGTGMWIWYVSQAEHGNLVNIIARARNHKVRTVFVKSGDGSAYWNQFDQVVGPLHQAGIKVCAWQFVYGNRPLDEAAVGASAVAAGADCLVIDAESAYNNRYNQATSYLVQLRSQIGMDYPVGLTSFAYPDYHPTFPYSVFLANGGAQWNLPQMYFKAFGQPIPTVFGHTFGWNQIYGRPIVPIGQTYLGVSKKLVTQFRRYARRYRVQGLSWWVWQDTKFSAWRAVGAKLKPGPTLAAPAIWPILIQGNQSDMVRWAQVHLLAAGIAINTDGKFSAVTTAAVNQFQLSRALPLNGTVDQLTWQALLKVNLPVLQMPTPPTGPTTPAAPTAPTTF